MTGKLTSYPALALTFGVAVIINLTLWALSLLVFPRQDTGAVLHYNIDVGIDFIGDGKQIIVLPIAGLIIIVGNGLLGLVLRRVEPIAAWVVWGVVPVAQVVLIGAFFLIRQANL